MFALCDDGCYGPSAAQSLTDDALVLVCRRHTHRLVDLRRDIAETRRLRRYLGNKFDEAAA
jgi:hypothetical protein